MTFDRNFEISTIRCDGSFDIHWETVNEHAKKRQVVRNYLNLPREQVRQILELSIKTDNDIQNNGGKKTRN